MKVRPILALMAFVLVAPSPGFPATDVASYNIYMRRGLSGIQRGTVESLYSAKKDFEHIIRHEDWDAVHRSVAYHNLGVIGFMENNLDSAIKNYLSAIELNPEYSEAYFNLGGAYYKQGLLKKAEEVFLKAIELQPEYGRAHYSLGFVYLDQKKYDLARAHAEKAAEYGVPFRTLKERLAKISR